MVTTGQEVYYTDEMGKEHYAAIGRVAAEWSALESNLDFSALRLGKINHEAGVCLTAQVAGSGRKLDAYIAIAQLRGAKKVMIAKLHEFAKDTKGLAEQRNRVVHDPWQGSQNPHRLEATARGKLKLEFVHVPTAAVLELSQKISVLAERFFHLNEEVRADVGDGHPDDEVDA
jgi:hypothetical protein